jgi:hypothetical protein
MLSTNNPSEEKPKGECWSQWIWVSCGLSSCCQ